VPDISKLRKIYFVRLAGRCLILAACIYLYLMHPQQLEILEKGSFRKNCTWLHVLWIIWMIDMLHQLLPAKKNLALGSKKNFKEHFRAAKQAVDLKGLKRYILTTTAAAYRICLLWAALLAVLGVLHRVGWLENAHLFLISVLFYVCDLICVLIWCPFRLMLKNRCCTTCRIFNWDHMMMFTPMIFIGSFYAGSLLTVAAIVWCAWEICVLVHPERFWFQSNENLQCSNCTDKLCTQYCQKLRTPGQRSAR